LSVDEFPEFWFFPQPAARLNTAAIANTAHFFFMNFPHSNVRANWNEAALIFIFWISAGRRGSLWILSFLTITE
jgi:hypothetical protein